MHDFETIADNVLLFGTQIDIHLAEVDANIKEQLERTQGRIDRLHVRLQQ